MRSLILLGCACLATVTVNLRAEDPSAAKKAADATSATYVITGLHCPPWRDDGGELAQKT